MSKNLSLPQPLCDGSTIPLQSNPDISGVGVLVGFLGTGLITVMVLVAFYIFSHDADVDHFHDPDTKLDRSDRRHRPQPLDKLVLGWLRGKWRLGTRVAALHKCVLAMADVQILTGLGILTSGFLMLPQGIQAYHWQLIVYLSWFSALTHLAALTLMRQQLHGWPSHRIFRIFLMFILVVMLIVALIPTANFDMYDEDGRNAFAVCSLIHPAVGDVFSFTSMVFSAVGIFGSFVTRSIRLFESADDQAWKFRGLVSRLLKAIIRKSSGWVKNLDQHGSKFLSSLTRSMLYQPILALYLFSRALADIYTSLLWEIVWLLYGTMWGCLKLLITRRYAPNSSDWSYGQILPMFLLLTPLVTLGELFWPAESETMHQSEDGFRLLSPSETRSAAPKSGSGSHDNILQQDVYQVTWFRYLIALLFTFTVTIAAWACYIVTLGGSSILSVIIWIALYPCVSGLLFALYSITFQSLEPSRLRTVACHWAIPLSMLVVLAASSMAPFCYVISESLSSYSLIPIHFVLMVAYVLGSFIAALFASWKKR